MDISWITDEDDFVANPERLDDAHEFCAALSGLYLKHKLGIFMMNTPKAIDRSRMFEDLLAIPDLAAGMISQVLATMVAKAADIWNAVPENQEVLTAKSDVIADWFWHNLGSLKKSCIVVDQKNKNQY